MAQDAGDGLLVKAEDERRLTKWFDAHPDYEIQSKRHMDSKGISKWLTFIWRPDLNRYIGSFADTREESEIAAIQRAIKMRE